LSALPPPPTARINNPERPFQPEKGTEQSMYGSGKWNGRKQMLPIAIRSEKNFVIIIMLLLLIVASWVWNFFTPNLRPNFSLRAFDQQQKACRRMEREINNEDGREKP